MQQSTGRILTTHTGSLPRPPDLVPLLFGEDEADAEHLRRGVREAVDEIVARRLFDPEERPPVPTNDGPIGYIGEAALADELDDFAGALSGQAVTEGFLPAISPDCVAMMMPSSRRVRINPKDRADIRSILQYTLQTWGRA